MDLDATFDTGLCRVLGIRYPICQAGMGFVAPRATGRRRVGRGRARRHGAGSMKSIQLRDEIRLLDDSTDRP